MNIKYRKAQDGFDFKLSLSSELNIFHRKNFNNKENLNHVIKLGLFGAVTYFLSLIPSGI